MNAPLRFMSRRVWLFVFATLISIISFGQPKTVTCKIVDPITGKPLPDTTVMAKGPAQTTTNSAGWFTITAPSPLSVLSVSYIGYGT